MNPKTQEQLIDDLLKDYKGPDTFWGETGLFAQLKKKIIERTLHAEMDILRFDPMFRSIHSEMASGKIPILTQFGTGAGNFCKPLESFASYIVEMDRNTE